MLWHPPKRGERGRLAVAQNTEHASATDEADRPGVSHDRAQVRGPKRVLQRDTFAMSGASKEHNMIASNINSLLNVSFRSSPRLSKRYACQDRLGRVRYTHTLTS